MELLRNEMKRYKCNVLGIAEMCGTGTGEMNGGEIIWSGEEKEHTKGVGFLLSPRARASLLKYKSVNPRIILARFEGNLINMSVIQVNAPTAER